MAEVIGIASGALTFATVVAQFTKSIITINSYCSQIKDAPHDLRILLNELELFGFILTDIEEDLAKEEVACALAKNKQVTKSLGLCKQAAEDLESITTELAPEFSSPGRMKRSYASVKIVLQRGKIERLKQRLHTAGQLLQLSQQCYTRLVSNPLVSDVISTRVFQSSTADSA